MRLGIIIPAFNAELKLMLVINSVKQYTQNIVVIDDGSTDNTKKIAHSAHVHVLSHPKNRGKGEALKSGFRFALNSNWDIVITIDADGQHNPSFIPILLQKYNETHEKIIIGSRMGAIDGMPFHRILSNKITSGLVSLRAGKRIPDSQSGFRLIHADVLRKIVLNTSRYETETEILIKSGIAGFTIGSICINTIYDNEPSSMHLVKDTWRFVKLYLKSLYEY